MERGRERERERGERETAGYEPARAGRATRFLALGLTDYSEVNMLKKLTCFPVQKLTCFPVQMRQLWHRYNLFGELGQGDAVSRQHIRSPPLLDHIPLYSPLYGGVDVEGLVTGCLSLGSLSRSPPLAECGNFGAGTTCSVSWGELGHKHPRELCSGVEHTGCAAQTSPRVVFRCGHTGCAAQTALPGDAVTRGRPTDIVYYSPL